MDKLVTPPRSLRNKHLDNVHNYSTPLQIPPSPFLRALGHGTGVSVYRLDRSPKLGELRSPWAIKQVTRRSRANETDKLYNERILQEADILRKLNHPNIVGYRGVVKSTKGVGGVALECCNASLAGILDVRHENKLGALPSKQCIQMIIDIAKALDYLHTEARILHCDIKSSNILIKGDFKICKLCDFGVSLPLDDNGEINFIKNPDVEYIGTELWLAPEVIAGDDILDSKVDIFSFGLTIYETLALVPPHTLYFKLDDDDDYETQSKDNSNFSDANIQETSKTEKHCNKCNKDKDDEDAGEANGGDSDDGNKGDNISKMFNVGSRPPLPMQFELLDEYNIVVELFYYCTNISPEDRPTAKTIWQSINDLKIIETVDDDDGYDDNKDDENDDDKDDENNDDTDDENEEDFTAL